VSRELLHLAVDIAQEAGALVRERAAGVVSVADTKTSDTDVVTEADRASETLVRRLLAQHRPDDAVMGEEGDDLPGTSGVRWIVDPIDGTVNFLYGLPEFAVSIAAEVDGTVVAGVVLHVTPGTVYTAFTDDDGVVHSARDGEPLVVRGPTPLAQRLVATGFSYDPAQREVQARAWVRLLPRVRDLRRHGSAALELCHVAEGRLDGYVEEGVHPWDYAAGALVAQGAGARFEGMNGVGGRFLALCAPEHGFEELREAVVEAGFTA
jgi:myo-inositol-1(or 4)-monophosphatase